MYDVMCMIMYIGKIQRFYSRDDSMSFYDILETESVEMAVGLGLLLFFYPKRKQIWQQ